MIDCNILVEVFNVIKDRKVNPKRDSYVSKIFKEGEEKILRKINEECLELILAAKDGSRKEIIHEATDLIFHVLLLLCYKDIDIYEIFEEFYKRRK